MLSNIKFFTLTFSIKCNIIRNIHLSGSSNVFWRKLRKINAEKRELEEIKLVTTSNEFFELSEHKIKELRRKDLIKSDEFIKKLIFEEAIFIYLQRYGQTRRGHVEFIYASLKKMKEFGVNHNLEIYKKILEIFPEVKMIPKTFWQTEMFHYPKQQECALKILVAMEENGVVPDEDFGRMLFRRFGLHTSPMVRYQRMLYWMPKFKNTNPWPVPQHLPDDPSEVARIALSRMSPEKETKVTLHEVEINEFEKTWIASAQSNVQKKLISYISSAVLSSQSQAQSDKSYHQNVVFVDGPFPVWVRNKCLNYYILNSELEKNRLNHHTELNENQKDLEKVAFDNWYTVFDPETQIPSHFGETVPEKVLPSQLTKYEDDIENRSVLASCILGNDSLNALRTWVNMIINDNSDLNKLKIVFRLTSRPADLVT